MFEIGDLVTIKPEFLDKKESAKLIYRVVNVNTVTKRCYIEIADCNLPLSPQELVSFDMIQKI